MEWSPAITEKKDHGGILTTYRIQFNNTFTFEDAISEKEGFSILDYIRNLGVSHVYSSPLLQAAAGSLHGYDVVDHTKFNTEIETGDVNFSAFAKELHHHGLGLLLDIVPNHMGGIDSISSGANGIGNRWWADVLEFGQKSRYSRYFDINWNSHLPHLKGKVMLPFLGDTIGKVLAQQFIKLEYKELKDEKQSCLSLVYYQNVLPVNIASYSIVLNQVLHKLKQTVRTVPACESHTEVPESEEILYQLIHLSESITDTMDMNTLYKMAGRIQREMYEAMQKEGLKKVLMETLSEINNDIDISYQLVKSQHYALCYWKAANDEINYRRFFDINTLIGVRVELPEVFEDVHRVLQPYLRRSLTEFADTQVIDGLRIDHIDGLAYPEEYLKRLHEFASPNLYVIVEKILEHNERLPTGWRAQGTTGYEFACTLNQLFVQPDNAKVRIYREKFNLEQQLKEIYQQFAPEAEHDFDKILFYCKKAITMKAMESSVNNLTNILETISRSHLDTQDYTHQQLKSAIMEYITHLPIYRTYIDPRVKMIRASDRRVINNTIEKIRRFRSLEPGAVNLLKAILLLEPAYDEHESQRTEFIVKLQQVSGPAMAKGLEDTALYRYFLLSSLNEVGGDPGHCGISVKEFHEENIHRENHWPTSLLTTSTHDTKRSEDVRARIHVLSEVPMQWKKAVTVWKDLNAELKSSVGDFQRKIPHSNEEYLLYQTLVGMWPFHRTEAVADTELSQSPSLGLPSHFVQRFQNFMLKAIKEAKLYTSWTEPNAEYEKAVLDFVDRILHSGAFLSTFSKFQKKIAYFGMWNSLSQLVLKLTVPGIPDIYQGTELWDLSLVDPDNRRPVNYVLRQMYLNELTVQMKSVGLAKLVEELVRSYENGKIKMYILKRILQLRNLMPQLFLKGSYNPLVVHGDKMENVVAFWRQWNNQRIVVVTARHFASLVHADTEENWSSFLPFVVGDQVWSGAFVDFDCQFSTYVDLLTGSHVKAERGLPVGSLFKVLPFAVLVPMHAEMEEVCHTLFSYQ